MLLAERRDHRTAPAGPIHQMVRYAIYLSLLRLSKDDNARKKKKRANIKQVIAVPIMKFISDFVTVD
jgi:hypothetical protein